MPLPFEFDFKNPDYKRVFEWRLQRLNHIRANTHILPALMRYYRDNPAQFIIDWGCTEDPRDLGRGIPTVVPFFLFPVQEEWVEWFLERWRTKTDGLTAKSRDMGVSWMCVAISATLALFTPGLHIAFGSRKEMYVDNSGDPKSIFYKLRRFLSLLPVEFRGGWEERKHAKHMLLHIPYTGSKITGEAGDQMGRGDRPGIHILDEAAFVSRPELIERSLSQATECRIDVSTPNGPANPFAEKYRKSTISKKTLHWRDNPKRDQAWYEATCAKIGNPVIIAQELDIDFMASVEGVLIPAIWVQAAIDAHLKLQISVTGKKSLGLDIADEGIDKNALAGLHGILVTHVESWSGSGSDLVKTTKKAISIGDNLGYDTFIYDAGGMGAGIRGIANAANEERTRNRKKPILFLPFWGAGAVLNPKVKLKIGEIENTHTNEDAFQNLKAQAWWILRLRFYLTYRAVMEKADFDRDSIISLDSRLKEIDQLQMELSQPTFSTNLAGKILIDKQPEGAPSPNLADAVMMVTAPRQWRGF